MTERQNAAGRREKDRPWLMRTYAGHSTAEASNELYRRNLAKGQTGLSCGLRPAHADRVRPRPHPRPRRRSWVWVPVCTSVTCAGCSRTSPWSR